MLLLQEFLESPKKIKRIKITDATRKRERILKSLVRLLFCPVSLSLSTATV
jgi:hypothetical protein